MSPPALIAKKSQHTILAPTRDWKLIDALSKLPTELLIAIARFYILLCEDDGDSDSPAVFSLTWLNRRLRQIVIGTPDLWASFGISDAEHSFHIARLCIERSRIYPLKIQINAFTRGDAEYLGNRCYDVLHPVASRIRVFKVYMIKDRSFNLGKNILARLDLPALEEISLHHDRMYHAGPIRDIEIPGGGASIQILTLRGLFPSSSNLTNLKSLTLISPWYSKWSPALISTLITESPSLENLTFIGTESAFEVEEDLAPYALSSSSLRYLTTQGWITFSFIARFLLALHAPNLESVRVTTPVLRVDERLAGAPVCWEEIIDQMDERFFTRKETFDRVRSLVLDPGGHGSSPHRNWGFFWFLMAAFPRITSLDLDQKDIEVLNICNGEDEFLEGGWAFLNQLTICGNPSHPALENLLDFIHRRNRNGHDQATEDGGKSGSEDRGDEEDEDYETEVDQDQENHGGRETENEGEHGRNGEVNVAKMRSGNDAGEAIANGVDEERGDLDFMPIERVVIRGWGTREAAIDEVIRRVKEE